MMASKRRCKMNLLSLSFVSNDFLWILFGFFRFIQRSQVIQDILGPRKELRLKNLRM